ncbi:MULTISPECIES: PadR family transcriptional regulator [Salimicrobium]|nr:MULTISPECIES: helix-turn-helix transcriptional regulator [Salimicrobium]
MSMQILILGLLRETPRHPYEMKMIMKQQHWDRLFPVTEGNLYHNIKRAAERGNIKAIKQEQVEKRPSRTVYEITEQGKEELSDRILHAFLDQKMEINTIYPALLFVRYSNRNSVAEAVRKWIESIEMKDGETRQENGAGYYIHKHFQQRMQIDREWLKEVAAWLEKSANEKT